MLVLKHCLSTNANCYVWQGKLFATTEALPIGSTGPSPSGVVTRASLSPYLISNLNPPATVSYTLLLAVVMVAAAVAMVIGGGGGVW